MNLAVVYCNSPFNMKGRALLLVNELWFCFPHSCILCKVYMYRFYYCIVNCEWQPFWAQLYTPIYVGLQRRDTLTWGIWCMPCHGFFRGILFTVIDAIVAYGWHFVRCCQSYDCSVCACVHACVLAVIGSMYLWGWVYLSSTVLVPFCTVIAFLSQQVQILRLRAMLVWLLLWLPAIMATWRSPICFSNMVSNYNICSVWQVLKHCLCKPASLHACGCTT